MAAAMNFFTSRPWKEYSCSSKRLFFLPLIFALTTSFLLFLHVSFTLKRYSFDPTTTHIFINSSHTDPQEHEGVSVNTAQGHQQALSTWPPGNKDKDKDEIYHDRMVFMKEYAEMKKKLKIFVYPHNRSEAFANVVLPESSEPGGNYASESYFKKSLMKSQFLTEDPSEAQLFYMPFSITNMRNDKRIGVGGIQDFIRSYVHNISHSYPFWNRTGGADHFYVACHSVGRSAMDKAVHVKLNAIQVVCSSSYFLQGYVAHKDVPLPQIWPRKPTLPPPSPSERKTLAFYAGAMNSPVRQSLVGSWRNDSEISVHGSRVKMAYSEALMGSRYCIHAKGFEVNTARIADALFYGCVPVVLADHYDLPFVDILNWNSFSVVVATADIPKLKKILKDIGEKGYMKMHRNVMQVKKHFQWHSEVAVDYDTFYMVIYELWLRRAHLIVPFS